MSRPQQKMSSDYMLVAAIDFGTTYSGYAFSFHHEFKKDPLRVTCNTWTMGNILSMKTPSCILFDNQMKFKSFGYEAEAEYGDLTLDDEHEQFFFFKRFKMLLYQCEGINQGIKLKDETGKEMKAIDVFSAAIWYLKEHLLDTVRRRGADIQMNEVKWVLTVPAIWDDVSKGFMREAAVQAGIPSERLELALEPEAAAMLCKYMKLTRNAQGDELTCFTPSSRYLVLDAGGGTVDITIHEVQRDSTLREICKANGGPWGGTTIDQAFFNLISSITGQEVWNKYIHDYQDDFFELQREFEIRKRTMKPDMPGKMTFRIPITLHELYRIMNNGKEMSQAARETKDLAGKLVFAGDKLRLENSVVKSLYQKTCTSIIDHLNTIFNESAGVNTILMVGGFSESLMLQEAIKGAFTQKKVLIPQEAGLAVLKGAVIFGHSDQEITSRISKYTYGLSTRRDFDPKIHPQSRLYVQSDGSKKVRHCFSVLVRAGEKVSLGVPCAPQQFVPSADDRTSFTIKLYASPDNDPQYVDEPGCVRIGEATVDCRDRHGRSGGASVSIMFGGTEIEVMAVNDLTGEQTKAIFKTV